jgi:hypothetical protein
MSELHPIEQELVEAADFTPEKNYRNRQKYLEALLRAANDDIDNDSFEKLSEGAFQWYNSAAEAHKAGNLLPDFNGEDHAADTDEEFESSGNETGEVSASESSLEDHEETEKVEKKKPAKKRGRGRPPKDPVRGAKPKREPKEKKGRQPPRGTNEWGIAMGTKSDTVCRLFAQEHGATMKDVKEAVGDTYYNLVNRLKRHGHTIIYNKETGNIRLINKDKA